MKTTTITSMKFLKLKRKLGLPHWQAVGLLESLWVFCMANAMAGDIGRHSNEDIAAAIEWAGDPDQLIENLIETGWLDRHQDCRLSVHDWDEHCPNFVKGVMAKKGKSFVSRPQPSSQPSTLPSSQLSSQPSTLPEYATLSGQPSNLTKPNLTKPNQGREGLSALAPEHLTTESLAHTFTTQWNFYARGCRPGNETFSKVIEVFDEAVRRGMSPEVISVAIANPKRDRSEPLFLFSDRVLRPQSDNQKWKSKSVEETIQRMSEDPEKARLLEVAFNGYGN